MPKINASNPGEAKLIEDVSRFGWHCMNVMGDEANQPFSYTIGLFHSYGYPELLIYGLSSETAHAILAIAANAVTVGTPIDLDKPTIELLEGLPCVFVRIPKSAYPEHLGFARWFYEGDNFPVHQVVWPSKKGIFPWHEEATEDFREVQPVLGQCELS